MVYAYLRQTSEQNSLSLQQQEILSYTLPKDIEIDKEVIEYSSINHPIEKRAEFEEFIQTLVDGDSIVVHQLVTLSSKIEEIIKLVNCMLTHNVNLYITSSKSLINRESKLVDIFPLMRDLDIEEREKRSQKGRPKGSRSPSKFDQYRSRIITLLKDGMRVSAISRELGVSRSSLKDYIESRELKGLIEKSWVEVSPKKEDDNISTLLICPYEKKTK
jgi:DNA invertase Pin-like site-specific DNA recombinase